MATATKTGIPMTKKNRLAILGRAREILSNKKNWGTGTLRSESIFGDSDDGFRYCVLGALERAAYDLELAPETVDSFSGSGSDSNIGRKFDAYLLGDDISLTTYAEKQFNDSPFRVNDIKGYEATLKMLDDYIARVKKTPAARL